MGFVGALALVLVAPLVVVDIPSLLAMGSRGARAIQVMLEFREQLRNFYRQERGVLAVLGSSVIFFAKPGDPEQRSLLRLIEARINRGAGKGPRVPVIGGYHGGFKGFEHYSLANMLIASSARTRAVFIEVNLRSFSFTWHVNRRWQFPEVSGFVVARNFLHRVSLPLVEEEFNTGALLFHFLDYQIAEGLLGMWLRGWKEFVRANLVVTRPSFWKAAAWVPRKISADGTGEAARAGRILWPPRGRRISAEEMFRAYYRVDIANHPNLDMLHATGVVLKREGHRVIFYITPLPMHAIGRLLGPAELQYVESSVRGISRWLCQRGWEVIDCHDLLGPRYFMDFRNAEHITGAGKRILADRLVEFMESNGKIRP